MCNIHIKRIYISTIFINHDKDNVQSVFWVLFSCFQASSMVLSVILYCFIHAFSWRIAFENNKWANLTYFQELLHLCKVTFWRYPVCAYCIYSPRIFSLFAFCCITRGKRLWFFCYWNVMHFLKFISGPEWKLERITFTENKTLKSSIYDIFRRFLEKNIIKMMNIFC